MKHLIQTTWLKLPLWSKVIVIGGGCYIGIYFLVITAIIAAIITPIALLTTIYLIKTGEIHVIKQPTHRPSQHTRDRNDPGTYDY